MWKIGALSRINDNLEILVGAGWGLSKISNLSLH